MNQIHEKISRRLRDEAEVDSPAYSPLLHLRIMQQITHLQPSRTTPARSAWKIGRMIPPAAAAAIVLATTLLWLHFQQPGASVVVKAKSAALPTMNFSFPTITANNPLNEEPYGSLDRDAKSAARFVMDQFDVLPTGGGRRG